MRVVITGASRGIGAGLAEIYRARGDEVIGTTRAMLDVTDPASQRNFAASLNGAPVDLLVCNAGVYLDNAETLDTGYDAQLWADTFATNVTGVFLTAQSLLPNLRAASGKIAIIASQMGSSTRAKGTSIVYRVSKSAAINLGMNLAAALRPDGIPVGIYHPGWVQTDMGGPSADITTDESVTGLAAQFDTLTLSTSGQFQTWDGQPHPL